MTAFARTLSRPRTLVPSSVGRVRYSPAKIVWLYGVGALAALGLPHVSGSRVLVAAALGFVTACCGHSVGLHRGLIHGAFRMGPRLRRVLLLLFCQTGLGGPRSWIRLHHVRDHWQSRPDTPAYFAYRHGLLADYVWNLHMTFVPADPADWTGRYGIERELEEDPFLRRLEATWRLQVAAAFALVWLGFGFGAAAVVVAGRVAVTNLFHWFVGYFSHVHGRMPFEIDGATEEGRDGWLLGALSFGEGFHNTHHALPRSARMGLGRRDLDLGFLVVRALERLGWVQDVVRPDDPRSVKEGARPRSRPRRTAPARNLWEWAPLLHALLLFLSLSAATTAGAPSAAERPNVVVVITDDQGWGDFGFHGNPVIETPSLDRLAAQSARVENFYVSPVCAPTRAALMTGRWTQRTRAIDTYIGRAMMEPAEVTLAEALGGAGYATGIFGKWHLGDCYPMRPQDQGFEKVLVHRGGGIGQPSDPEGGEGKYTDPVLFEDGVRRDMKGYCTDLYFDAALEFMTAAHAAERPFFAYVATNAPHGPFHDVPRELLAKYRESDLSPDAFPATDGGHALPAEHDENRLAQIYAMITNIDEGVGRMLAKLDELEIADDTIVVFLVDNGPNSRRYVGGMRGQKSHVYEGGVRSPLWIRWPARLTAGATTDRVAAHVDLMPTLLEACAVAPPADVALDGRSLLPLLDGGTDVDRSDSDWADRDLVIQAHRGDRAVRYHNFLLRNQRWKLLNASGFGRELEEVEPSFELYDMAADPLETRDVASAHPEVVAELVARYDAWFDDVSSTRPDNYAPPRIVLGADAAPETHLTRQDWRRASEGGGWERNAMGYWEVDVVDPGPYTVRVRFPGKTSVESVELVCGEARRAMTCAPDGRELVLEEVLLPKGPAPLWAKLSTSDGKIVGALQLVVRRR